MSTGIHQPSARSCFFTAGLLYFESNSCSFCDAYCHDIQGAGLSKPLVLFWHRHREGAWNKLATATLSWLSFISDTLNHLTLLSRSLRNRWKEASGIWLGLLSQLVTYVQVYRVVLNRTSTDSHSLHTVVNVQVSCLSLRLLKLGNRYSCSNARVSKRPPADLAIHRNTLRAAKEQPDVTSYIPCILSLTGLLYTWHQEPRQYSTIETAWGR